MSYIPPHRRGQPQIAASPSSAMFSRISASRPPRTVIVAFVGGPASTTIFSSVCPIFLSLLPVSTAISLGTTCKEARKEVKRHRWEAPDAQRPSIWGLDMSAPLCFSASRWLSFFPNSRYFPGSAHPDRHTHGGRQCFYDRECDFFNRCPYCIDDAPSRGQLHEWEDLCKSPPVFPLLHNKTVVNLSKQVITNEMAQFLTSCEELVISPFSVRIRHTQNSIQSITDDFFAPPNLPKLKYLVFWSGGMDIDFDQLQTRITEGCLDALVARGVVIRGREDFHFLLRWLP